jgi:FkbM family methyltransferase
MKLEKDDIVVDIGAHVGIFAILVALMYPEAKVYAFEPLPANFYFLQKNIARHKVDNVVAVNKGLLKPRLSASI